MLVINKIIQNKGVDLWEAWIDDQVIGSGPRVMLYVVGEVFGSKNNMPKLVKRASQPQPSELHLDIIGQGSTSDIEEIFFSEVVPDYCPYNEVVIYNDDVAITSIEVERLGDMHYL